MLSTMCSHIILAGPFLHLPIDLPWSDWLNKQSVGQLKREALMCYWQQPTSEIAGRHGVNKFNLYWSAN